MRAFGVSFRKTLCRRRICYQMLFGTARPLNEIAATIGAGVVEQAFRAGGAKCAFKSAHPGVRRRWRQVLVATFAIGFEC